jgi:glycosyltransferase involved in cell wall biosynthesis
MQYLRQPNRGLPAARNAAAMKASGEFLAYLDADDAWYPNKLERQVAFLDASPSCAIVHSEVVFIDESDRLLVHAWYRESGSPPAQGKCLLSVLESLHIQVPTVIERRTAFDRVGGFDERLRRCEDYLHWVDLLLDGHSVGYIDEPLAMYRRRAGSLSKNRAAMGEGLLRMFRILVEERGLFERAGADAQEIVLRRVATLERNLPKWYRWDGRRDVARGKAANLIRKFPFELDGYVELLKACVPAATSRLSRRRQPSPKQEVLA